MQFKVNAEDFVKLLQYPDSIAVRIGNGILAANARLKGLETMVAFSIKSDEPVTDFFAVTMTAPAMYFKTVKDDITVELKPNSISFTSGMMLVEVPINRDILADFELPPFDEEHAQLVDKFTRIGLRSMLSTMSEVSKTLMDYSGTVVRLHNGSAVLVNNSMCVECAVHLPDMCVSASAMLSMLSLTNAANKLVYTYDDVYVVFATDDIVIRIPKCSYPGSPVNADILLGREVKEVEVTVVKHPGLSESLKALASFKDANSAALIYNETGMEFSMRGNGYSITPTIDGHTIFINPRVLIMLGKFLCSDEYTIKRGDKYVCLCVAERKLTVCATSY